MDTAVTTLLDTLNHPLRTEIEEVRKLILTKNVTENIKWNSPNYHINGQDRLTLRVQPKNIFQLILHGGVKKQEGNVIRPSIDDAGLLEWKGNDRAVLELGKASAFSKALPHLSHIISQWLETTII